MTSSSWVDARLTFPATSPGAFRHETAAHAAELHKLFLEVFAHNETAVALYRKSGFAEEGRRPRQYRRASGELWDSIVMGLPL